MSTHAILQKPIASPRRSSRAPISQSRGLGVLLQRKCNCGASHSECEDCKKTLQRSATATGPATAPPLVHNVLRAPGQPLDKQSRTFYEPIFGYDFSRVRIHTNHEAAQSARSVNAVAYTVGHHVVFDSGRYEPRTHIGRQLIAHELTHVVQQSTAESSCRSLSIGRPGDQYEQQADQIAASIANPTDSDHASQRNTIKPAISPRGLTVLRRKIPTGISLAGVKSFGHSDLTDEADKEKYLTNIGAVSLLQLTPPGDYTEEEKRGDCTKEFLTEVSNTCPASPKPFCSGNVCFQVNRSANSGDPKTGNVFAEDTDSFVDRHIARYDTSFLAGSGKSQCSVVCHQTYKYRTEPDRKYHELGSFYIIRNFKAGSYTPKGKKTPLNITTGSIQKIPAPASAPSKEDFIKKEAPGLVKSGKLLDVPAAPKAQSAP